MLIEFEKLFSTVEGGYMKHLDNFICSKFRNSRELYNLHNIHNSPYNRGSTDGNFSPHRADRFDQDRSEDKWLGVFFIFGSKKLPFEVPLKSRDSDVGENFILVTLGL